MTINPLAPSASNLANFIGDRMSFLGKDINDLSDACRLFNPLIAQMLLDGRAKVPAMFIEPIAALLQVDAHHLRQLLLDEYLPGFGPARFQQVGEIESGEPLANKRRSPVSGDIADGDSPGIGRITMPMGKVESVDHDDDLFIPTLRVRHLFVSRPDGFTAKQAACLLLLKTEEADWLLTRLATLGYVACSSSALEPAVWRLTDRGTALACCKAPQRLDRQSEISVLSDFMRHIATVNARPDLAYCVSGVTVIGELLTALDESDIPHVEVTVVLSPRNQNPERQMALLDSCLEAARADCLRDGIDFSDLGDAWPVAQVQEAIREGAGAVALRWFFE